MDKKWFKVKIVGRSEGPLRVKVSDPNEAIRAGTAWIDAQVAGGDDGNVAYHITNVYLDPDQAERVGVEV